MHLELFLAIFHLVPYYLLLHNLNYNEAFIFINVYSRPYYYVWIDPLSQKWRTFAMQIVLSK